MSQQTGISPSSSSIPISAAENYQLKWNSHVSNLNSNISSLYKNDKYADVMLFTSNIEEGFYGIPAHKLILGSCSHYFSSIFDNNPLPINTMIYIFLPPDLSKRAVATLIQYMYTGEATVANDILNEVLKGGEILKIRGLCKVNSGASSTNSKYSTPIDSAHHQPQQIHSTTTTNSYPQSYKLIESGPSVNASPLKSNKSTPRNSIDKTSSIHPDTRNSSTISHHHHILTQNESPVVVMSTQSNQAAQAIALNGNSNSQQQHQQVSQSNNLIIVKKDMAIDPGDTAGNIPVEHYGLISLKIAAAVKKAQQQNISATVKKSPSTSSGDQHQRRADFYQIDENLRYDAISSPTAFKVYTSSSSCENLQQIHQSQMSEDALRYTEKKKRIAQNQKPSSSSDGIRESSKGNKFTTPENGQSYQLTAATHEIKNPHFPEALSFLTIKEEPIEWTEFDNNGLVSQVGDNRTDTVTIKPENLEDVESALSSEMNDKVYSPLTCEVCNLKFQIPSAWVRHIESHSELNQAQTNIPKKRKKVEEEENSENINVLSCDLCENMSFATPAQWVRHVQNTHTETELAMSNNSILLKKTNIKQPKESPVEKPAICSICKKAFPTYASMLIHKRTHSEEKPFACGQPNCNRGFNIKSNLLRHMRTCHNQIPSSENQDSDNVD